LLGYELYLDDGLGGTLTSTDPVDVANKPYLQSYEVTFVSALTGRNFRAFLRAIN
jgi:hypothetical protein